ncbi:tRNA methyltransferase 10 homolog A, partial [Eurytemora carolleeae]|uniref:tRNA methyltransferase 10 homolog A n=1 Tax=Eurytemora carolleeae TaxID=1294199 RepID=UPI000C76E5EE
MARVAEERGGFPESRSSARKRIKKEQVPMSESECKIGVIFDMQFDHLMHQRDLGKCIKQILRCYSNNRRLKAPLQMYMTSFKGKVEEEMNK